MELLPEEFKKFAQYMGLSDKAIAHLIGDDLVDEIVVDSESLTWRELPSQNTLSVKNWKLLEKPSKTLELKKIARRQVFQAYKLFCPLKCEYLSMLGITQYNGLLFEAYDNEHRFINSLIDNYRDLQTVDQDLKIIENMSKEEWFVIVALIELFLEKYPTPDSHWLPSELLVFTKDSLVQIIKESENRVEDQTWWGHWKAISNAEIPTIEDIETAILMLSNKKLIGYMSHVEGEDIYYIGQELLWLIRALVWWDRGFVIEDKRQHISLYCIQASSLFVLLNEKDRYYSLFNINAVDLEKVMANFLTLEEEHQQLFCTNCGKRLPLGAKFCPYCGVKIV